MNCAFHSDREVRGICTACGRPLCEECLLEMGGEVHCRACLDSRRKAPPREVSSLIRFALSVVPGLGHLYMGLFNRGIQLGAGAVLGSFVLNTLMPTSALPGFLVAALIFVSIFDAREAHLRMAQGLEVEDKAFVDLKTMQPNWNSRYTGYALIAVGAIALYNAVMRDLLVLLIPYGRYKEIYNAINGSLIGLLAIAGGLWMLRRGSGKSAGE